MSCRVACDFANSRQANRHKKQETAKSREAQLLSKLPNFGKRKATLAHFWRHRQAEEGCVGSLGTHSTSSCLALAPTVAQVCRLRGIPPCLIHLSTIEFRLQCALWNSMKCSTYRFGGSQYVSTIRLAYFIK